MHKNNKSIHHSQHNVQGCCIHTVGVMVSTPRMSANCRNSLRTCFTTSCATVSTCASCVVLPLPIPPSYCPVQTVGMTAHVRVHVRHLGNGFECVDEQSDRQSDHDAHGMYTTSLHIVLWVMNYTVDLLFLCMCEVWCILFYCGFICFYLKSKTILIFIWNSRKVSGFISQSTVSRGRGRYIGT